MKREAPQVPTACPVGFHKPSDAHRAAAWRVQEAWGLWSAGIAQSFLGWALPTGPCQACAPVQDPCGCHLALRDKPKCSEGLGVLGRTEAGGSFGELSGSESDSLWGPAPASLTAGMGQKTHILISEPALTRAATGGGFLTSLKSLLSHTSWGCCCKALGKLKILC